jgi:hypothetical protein
MNTYGRVEVELHHSLIGHLMEVSAQLHTPAILHLVKSPMGRKVSLDAVE